MNSLNEIYNNIIENYDFTIEMLCKIINTTVNENLGMFFTLYLFICGIYLIGVTNLIKTTNDINEKTVSSIAVKKKLIKRKQLKQNFTNNNAESLIENVLDFVFAFSNDNQYCDVIYRDNVNVYDINEFENVSYKTKDYFE